MGVYQLQVGRILDNRTLVLIGSEESRGQFWEGMTLMVVGIGARLYEGGPKLVVPKGNVEITADAGHYFIASSPIVQTREQRDLFAPLGIREVTVRNRPALNVNERAMSGNPARDAIEVGDICIAADAYKQFVAQISSTPDEPPKEKEKARE